MCALGEAFTLDPAFILGNTVYARHVPRKTRGLEQSAEMTDIGLMSIKIPMVCSKRNHSYIHPISLYISGALWRLYFGPFVPQ